MVPDQGFHKQRKNKDSGWHRLGVPHQHLWPGTMSEHQWPANSRFPLSRRSPNAEYWVISRFGACSSERATSREKKKKWGEEKKTNPKCVLMIAPDYNLVLCLQVSGFVQVHNGVVECFPAVLQNILCNNREIIYWREWADSCISSFVWEVSRIWKQQLFSPWLMQLRNPEVLRKLWSN